MLFVKVFDMPRPVRRHVPDMADMPWQKTVDRRGNLLYNGRIHIMKEEIPMKRRGWKAKKELSMRQKAAGTVLCLLLYRAMCHVPLPYMEPGYLDAMLGAPLGLLDAVTGGSLGSMSLASLGVGPWITASIVLQLLGVAFPKLSDMDRDADGKRKKKMATFLLSAALAVLEASGLAYGHLRGGYLEGGLPQAAAAALTMAAGSGMLSALALFIDWRLFGSGTSLILTAGILASWTGDAAVAASVLTYGLSPLGAALALAAAAAGVVLLAAWGVLLASCEKKLPVAYARQARGNMRQTGEIPLKPIPGGVVPVIFASTVVSLPVMAGALAGYDAAWLKMFDTGSWLRPGMPWASIGFLLYVALIVGFGHFCQMLYVNPDEVARNLQEAGGTVPGVRPGRPTAQHIRHASGRLVTLGGLCLAVMAAVPIAVSGMTGLSNLSFLGTSMLIVISTVDDTWKAWKTGNLQGRHRMGGIL